MTRSEFISHAALVIIFVLAGLAIFPFYWMFVTATTSDANMFAASPQLVPSLSQLGIFAQIFEEGAVKTWLANSFIIAAGTTVLTLALAIPLGYAFARFPFWGKAGVGIGLLVTQMLPEAVLVVPLFSIFSPLGLLNSYAGLILANTAFTLPVITWILKNAFDTVPVEIEEAAVLDGCTGINALVRVVLPVIMPSVAASAVIAFFHGWNEYVFALTFITNDTLKPASVGLAGFIGEISTPIQSVMAVGVVYTLPAVALYLLMQRFIVSGMAAGSVKG
ncbi:carbohydrate ABC transporter permease [Nitratireductor indicus]|uniref:Binding-protein-dependent transport system inner membrane protein n=1 Tax=Nitratireductor indicus C115 TaxID=1231190 RepID=K2NTL4_9HYPH|nr:carbohydrate ABC transporter permease [Nitratireductor indicus]EKF42605.1 binding-protein-dependent transport system inner membrane protein [Nitratireductor indicus C115]MDS1138094.1 carbohydrate ABC transporter permease [Nitratireductor indicus]SFQ57811.1 multiple sugar transport system permease protein [Nitratireductor indicus]